jgi:hypothetical protein
MLKPLAEDPESVLRITMLADRVKTSVSPASDSKYILGYLPDLGTRMVRSVSTAVIWGCQAMTSWTLAK